MRVRATRNGYYHLVYRYGPDAATDRKGDVFDLRHPEDFSPRWMEKVDAGVEKTPAPGEPLPGEMPAPIGRTPTVTRETQASGPSRARAKPDAAKASDAPKDAPKEPEAGATGNRDVI